MLVPAQLGQRRCRGASGVTLGANCAAQLRRCHGRTRAEILDLVLRGLSGHVPAVLGVAGRGGAAGRSGGGTFERCYRQGGNAGSPRQWLFMSMICFAQLSVMSCGALVQTAFVLAPRRLCLITTVTAAAAAVSGLGATTRRVAQLSGLTISSDHVCARWQNFPRFPRRDDAEFGLCIHGGSRGYLKCSGRGAELALCRSPVLAR